MRKIMFNDRFGLTQAVLDGRKTMTRRVVSPSVIKIVEDFRYKHYPHNPPTKDTYRYLLNRFLANGILLGKGFYKLGETIAIAQAYQTLRWPALPGIDWKAITDEVTHSKGWTNKMFVEAEYMPYRIRITNMQFEMLKEISNEDAIREGVYYHPTAPLFSPYDRYSPWHPSVKPYKYSRDNCIYFSEARYAFRYLCKKVFGADVWACNPIVCAYDFVQIK